MEHEILFEQKGQHRGGGTRVYSASSVNGMTLKEVCIRSVQNCLIKCGCPPEAANAFGNNMTRTSADVKALEEWLTNPSHAGHRNKVSDVLTSYFSYMGVAVTPCTSGPRGGTLQRQGFSASRGGLMTVINTGKEPLRAGDKVRMVIDVLDVVSGRRAANDHITGIPRTKVVARLAHVPPSNEAFADIADGITSRDINVRVDEPNVLIPDIAYMGRERHAWETDGDDAGAFVIDNDATVRYLFNNQAFLNLQPRPNPAAGFDIYSNN